MFFVLMLCQIEYYDCVCMCLCVCVFVSLLVCENVRVFKCLTD